MFTLKKLLSVLSLLLLLFLAVSCEEDEDETIEMQEEAQVQVNDTSIIPNSIGGRPNTRLGCIEINSRITTIEVWDHGAIDGDIVSIIANNEVIIDEELLDGPDNAIVVDYNFQSNGFNYLTLFAHNEGDISPNTCTVRINGVSYVLEANLQTNGSVDVVVTGFGVSCDDSQGDSGGNGGNGGQGDNDNNSGSGRGDVIFWINQDYGCGNITVDVDGVGTTTISGFYPDGSPTCSDTGAGGNFNDLPEGQYSFTASCQDFTGSGNFTISEDSCLVFELRI